MKSKIIFILCLFSSLAIFAEPSTSASITTGIMLSPASEPIAGDDHFAPSTGFSGFGAYVQGSYGTQFPISLGEHPIFAGSFIKTTADIMLTPC